MQIRLSRRTDGATTLVCRRADGTESWQRHEKAQARHFPLHDLTHFAVETTLGLREAFYGLVAAGWELEDTTGKGARGALPPEAVLAEHLVGLLDVERAGTERWDAETVVSQLDAAGVAISADLRLRLDDATLGAIRARRAEFFAQWDATPPGGTLTLEYPG